MTRRTITLDDACREAHALGGVVLYLPESDRGAVVVIAVVEEESNAS